MTRALLACGAVGGPLFFVVSLIQAFTRDGFDLRLHPFSMQSLGDLGWIQITNFVVSGVLCSRAGWGCGECSVPAHEENLNRKSR